jgi:hypothetical protein
MISAPNPRFRRREAAARYVSEKWGLPCSKSWLAKLAVVGGGPLYRKAGKVPLYQDVDLDHWAEARLGPTRRSTSEVAVPPADTNADGENLHEHRPSSQPQRLSPKTVT